MDFAPYKVVANDPVCDDITVVTLDGNINIQAGEYVFVWIPGVGEKPFSCLTDSPLRLAVIDVGQFTSACYQLKPGDDVYIRGPHGAPVMPKDDAILSAWLAAPVWPLCTRWHETLDNDKPAQIFAGARSADRLYFTEECKDIAEVHIATDDGSAGFNGRVTDALRDYLETLDADTLAKTEFYNCGPEPMIHAAEAYSENLSRHRRCSVQSTTPRNVASVLRRLCIA